MRADCETIGGKKSNTTQYIRREFFVFKKFQTLQTSEICHQTVVFHFQMIQILKLIIKIRKEIIIQNQKIYKTQVIIFNLLMLAMVFLDLTRRQKYV